MKAFYNVAEKIWADSGALHYTNKLGLNDFIQELREMIPKTWHEGLVKHVEYVYFKAKDHGIFPRWYSIDDETARVIQHRKDVDRQIRDKQVQNTRIAHENFKKKINASYDIDTCMKQVRNQGSKIERRMDGELFYNSKMINLMDRVKQSDYKELSRMNAAESKQKEVTEQETRRLNDLIAANRRNNPDKWRNLY